jgi:hypothetical protein
MRKRLTQHLFLSIVASTGSPERHVFPFIGSSEARTDTLEGLSLRTNFEAFRENSHCTD